MIVRLYFLLFITCVSFYPSLCQNALVIPGFGEWNYRIEQIIQKSNEIEQLKDIDFKVHVKCLESSDDTGEVKVKLKIESILVKTFRDEINISVTPKNPMKSVHFNYIPIIPGDYLATIELVGGWSYLHQFDSKSTKFKVNDNPSFRGLRVLPPGLKMRTPIKDDGTTVFTFELDPIAVYSCSNNLNVAEYYSTFMIWYIAQNRWKNIDVNIMAAIDIAIGLKAIELFNNANLHLNESLQVQFSCNDSALAVVEFFRGIEMIFMTFKLINQPYLLQNLPLIDIPAF